MKKIISGKADTRMGSKCLRQLKLCCTQSPSMHMHSLNILLEGVVLHVCLEVIISSKNKFQIPDVTCSYTYLPSYSPLNPNGSQ